MTKQITIRAYKTELTHEFIDMAMQAVFKFMVEGSDRPVGHRNSIIYGWKIFLNHQDNESESYTIRCSVYWTMKRAIVVVVWKEYE